MILKLSNDILDEEFELIAISTSFEDYRLVYFLNKELKIRLSRNKEKGIRNRNEPYNCFSYYQWHDENTRLKWHCISNKIFFQTAIDDGNSLFDKVVSVNYLIDQRKETDFFLKIDTREADADLGQIISAIRKIPNILAAYSIDVKKLSFKHKLIFQEC